MFIKRLLAIILFIFACLYFPGLALAQDDITNDALLKVKEATVLYLDSPKALVNGESRVIDQSNMEVCPTVQGGRTLLPLRFVSEGLGANVAWNSKSNTATVKLDETTVLITLGKKEMSVNDTPTDLDVPAELRLGRTYIPLRAIAEALHKKVFFNSGLIVISSQDNILDPVADEAIIDELIFKCTGTGNTTGNLMNGAFYAACGDWLVFSNPFDKDRLYKSKFDGTKKAKLSNDKPYCINVIGNWTYYATPSGKRKIMIGDSQYDEDIYDIFKIRIDGSGRTKIGDDKSLDWFSVVGNWIYYLNKSNQICKMKVDGTEKTVIVSGSADPYTICVSNGWIYYEKSYDSSDWEEGLWRIRTDGTGNTKILDYWLPYNGFDIVGDQMYVCDTPGIFRMNLDGTGKVKIAENTMPDHMLIYDGWIYFWENKDKGSLYKIQLDGTKKTKVSPVNASALSIMNDWIFYRVSWTEGKVVYPFYQMRLDGSGKRRLGG